MTENKRYIIWTAWAENGEQQEDLTKLGDKLAEKYGASEAIAGRGEGHWKSSYPFSEKNSVQATELDRLIGSGEIKPASVLRVKSRRVGGELASMYDSVIMVAETVIN